MSRERFELLSVLNHAPAEARRYKGKSHGFPQRIVAQYFPGQRLTERLIQNLIQGHVLRWKEVLESFEFYGLVRSGLRRPVPADLYCGHGLVGVLFALLEEQVEHVFLVDGALPESLERTVEIATDLGPWVADKVRIVEAGAAGCEGPLPDGTSVAAVHACGALTDAAIDLAITLKGPVAVVPCCCHPQRPDAPPVLCRELGVRDAVDVHRTYRLHQAGYEVKWHYLPADITPMNRVLLAAPR